MHAGGGKRAVRDPLDEPPDVLIATPRCARDLMDEKTPAWFETVRTIVVDDADAILDLGDRESLDRVFEGLGHEHQRILLAAEAGGDVDDLAEARLPGAERVEFTADAPAPTRVKQVAIEIGERDAGDVLIDFVKQEHPKLVIVFTNDARSAERIAMRLSRARVSCRTVGQSRRPRDGDRRRPDPRGRGGSEVVVTHDPAPRRLSTIPASHVVHMELPADAETYFRRLRQCDRLHRRGSSIAFIGPDDAAVVESIESLLGTSLERIPGPRPVERSRPKRGGPRRDGAARAGSSGGETVRTGSSGDAPTGTNAPAAPAEEARPPSPAPATSSTTHRPPPPRTLGSRLPVKRKKRLR
ncbi:MAG: DEAD/DEAH box helicase [Planctomycetota bacterium]|nr:MAG: DEAD/DEAH box helicase [Planctomycetota bacterium]